jgi:O-antigen/teichoic acid export membrane protein
MNKDLVIIIIGRVLQIIIMLVSVRLLTTFLTPQEIGNYYIILAFLAFFNLVLLNPPGMYFSRHLLQWQKSKNLLNALIIFIGWMIVTAIIAIPISIAIYYWLGYETKFDLDLFLIYIVLAILISTLHRNVTGGCNTLGFRKEFVIYLIITLILGLAFSVTLVLYYLHSAFGWLFGPVLAELLMLYMVFRFFVQKSALSLEKIRVTLTKERMKKVLVFAVPIGATTFLMWGQNTAYRFIVDYKYSAEVLGYIAVGLGVSTAVFGALENIAMQYFSPIFLKKILDADRQQRADAWNGIAKQIVPIYIFTAVFTVVMAEVLINILVDKKFHDSYIYTMYGVGIEFFRVMTNLLTNVSQAEHRTTRTIKPYILGFLISVGVLSMVDFGADYYYIPMVLGCAYVAVFLSMFVSMKRLLPIRIQVNLLKVALLSLPFFAMLSINLQGLSIYYNLMYMAVFGVYFLCAVYLTVKGNMKEC